MKQFEQTLLEITVNSTHLYRKYLAREFYAIWSTDVLNKKIEFSSIFSFEVPIYWSIFFWFMWNIPYDRNSNLSSVLPFRLIFFSHFGTKMTRFIDFTTRRHQCKCFSNDWCTSCDCESFGNHVICGLDWGVCRSIQQVPDFGLLKSTIMLCFER